MYAILLTFNQLNENVGVGGSGIVTQVSWTKRAAKGGGGAWSIQPYFELSGTIRYRCEKQQLDSTAGIGGIPPPKVWSGGGLVLFAALTGILVGVLRIPLLVCSKLGN